MDCDVPAQPDEQTSGYEQAGPTAVRMLLGARLRRLRESAEVSREAAARAIRGSDSKISRMELGRNSLKLRDVTDLLDLYRVGPDERATLLTMAAHANAVAWWQEYGEAVPAWFSPYLGLEQAAEVIRSYQVQFIPGLLQTPDYARAVLAIGAADVPGTDVRRRVDLRMHRQEILHRPDPVRLWAVIDEAALRRPIGGRSVAIGQLRHLIEMSRLKHVNIQVALLGAGGPAVADGPVTMLRFREAELPDVAYLEHAIAASYLSKPAELAYYLGVLNRLVTQASPPGNTEAILGQILCEI
jgi:transcriptional regulator with XRE-family HTH domain